MSIDLGDYGLATDPFPLQPTSTVRNWAGRLAEKELLTDIVRTPLATDIGTSEFTVIHGDYGAGKSHSMRYFESMINEIEKDAFQSIAVYVPTSRWGRRQHFFVLYEEIIQIIGIDRLVLLATTVRNRFLNAVEDAKGRLTSEQSLAGELPEDYFWKLVFSALDQSNVPMLKLVLTLGEENQQAIEYLQGSKPPPSGIGLSGRVDSDFAAAKTLGSLLRVLSMSIRGETPACLATYLFLDEVESILDDRHTDLMQFFQGIRNLVNELPYNFCLIMSFSVETALIETVVPQPILERMTRQDYIELSPLTSDDAKGFLRELFEEYRPEGFSHTNPFHPFTEESIELVLEREAQINPRRLFRVLNMILIRAVRREGLAGGKEISSGLADSILSVGGIY